jgi:hypothetical protein
LGIDECKMHLNKMGQEKTQLLRTTAKEGAFARVTVTVTLVQVWP